MKNCLGKIMNSESYQELAQFAYQFLENQGAVLEKNKGGFEALLPEELSILLGTPDHICLDRESGPELRDYYAINYGSPLLEKMVDIACGEVPILAYQVEFDYLKSQGFDRLIEEQFNFDKWVGKVENHAKIRTYYFFLTCRYTAQSDEQKEGLIHLVFNYETGALVPRMGDMLSSVAKDFKSLPKPFWKERQTEEIMGHVKVESKKLIMNEINSFHESMGRRYRRDIANLEEYYNALEKEMTKSLERPGLSDHLIKERKEKIDLLPNELARKKDDLFKKYSIKIKIEPCAAILISTPAVKVLYRLSIGRIMKNISLIYNPITKSMDPLVCSGCGKSIKRLHFCNHLHKLCFACSERCPVC